MPAPSSHSGEAPTPLAARPRLPFNEERIQPGSIKRLVFVVVNAERDPAQRIYESGRVPSTAAVIDALLFGTGNHATDETQGFLTDVAKRWQDDLRERPARQIRRLRIRRRNLLDHRELRDAPAGEGRRKLLQVPTAFTIRDTEVTQLIDAGRQVLRASPEYQALRKSLGLSNAPAGAQ